MNLEYNFDDIVLHSDELRSLMKVKHKPADKNRIEHFDDLYQADLVTYRRIDERDPSHQNIYPVTVYITDKGLRYLIWLRRQRRKTILIPIIVAVIASLLTNGIIQLLRLIL